MRRSMRWLGSVMGAALVVFGLLCLNYTKASDWERHTQSAAKLGLPPPSEPILFGGAAAIALGAASIGFVCGLGGGAAGKCC